MDNVLFYTFSTIAATFGSAVGVIVAAAVFRMQKIDQILSSLATELMKYHPVAEQQTRLYRIILVQDWEKFLRVWREYHPAPNPENEFEKAHRWLIERTSMRLNRIRNQVRVVVALTLVLIAFCFVGLATTLVIQGFIAWDFSFIGSLAFNIPVVVALLIAGAILWLYGRATVILTKETDYSEP